MKDLTQFLEERLQEDLATIATVREERIRQAHIYRPGAAPDPDEMGMEAGDGNMDNPSVIVGPGRAMAEVEARRRIVEWHAAGHYCTDLGNMESWYLPADPCPTIRALALPYADHEQFQEEWRP